MNITEHGLCIDWGKRPWRGGVWGESKLAKGAGSGSLAPCFVNNDYVTAEIICSTAHMCHQVLAWSCIMCSTYVWAPPEEWRHYCCVKTVSTGPDTKGEIIVFLLLCRKWMLLNYGVGEDSWESLGLQGDPTSTSWRSVLGVHWKDWCWSWNSNTLATSCEELTHWKSLCCWEGLGTGGEEDARG